MTTTINKIAVIGAGTMGQGIAYVFAAAGFDTILFDAHGPSLQTAPAKIKTTLEQSVARKKMTAEKATEIFKKIKTVDSIEDVCADLIVEAVIEDLAIKRTLFKKIEHVNESRAILATNTSSLSVDAISAVLENSSNFLGVHFFNPAHLMQLVEVVSGSQTNPAVVQLVADLLVQAGKTVVKSADSPGFIVNRVARHFYLESLRAFEEESCSMEGIDSLLRSAGFKMGPFELMDLIGIDVNYAVSKSVHEGFNDHPRFKPSILQRKKVEEGKLGRKSGEGFYKYP